MEFYTKRRDTLDKFSVSKALELHIDLDDTPESMDEAIQKSGVWVNSPDKTGVQFWARNSTGKLRAIRHKSGGVIEISFSKMKLLAPGLSKVRDRGEMVQDIMKERVDKARERARKRQEERELEKSKEDLDFSGANDLAITPEDME